MKSFAALVLALALGSASAFMPMQRIAPSSMVVSAESRREFGAAAAALVAGAGFVQGASVRPS